ncbi:hypothetical protein, partial [uncultured Psychrobacter sp.]|uniref:hypothetical protein n=1 Tax=uncultured Psychrobacter sp. TaxID=259303 RepID=UPI0032B1B2BE
MKLIKLTAVSAAILGSTAAMAADPIVVVDDNDTVAYPVAAPAYQYNQDAGIIRNTTGAVVGTTKTLFNTAINPAAVSAEIGTLGYGANIAWSMNETTELQAGWAGGDVSDIKDDFDVDDVEYEIKDSDFSNPYLGVQMRPAANWFTVGAGIIVPDNDIDVEARGTGNFFEINDISYNTSEVGTLAGSVEHRNDLAPYLTVGFRPNISDRWGVFGEIAHRRGHVLAAEARYAAGKHHTRLSGCGACCLKNMPAAIKIHPQRIIVPLLAFTADHGGEMENGKTCSASDSLFNQFFF